MVEEWSDSSTENDRWTFETLDQADAWVAEHNQEEMNDQ